MRGDKKAQVAIYIIIAAVIVGLIAGFYALRGVILPTAISPELTPAFDYYQQCIEQEARNAIDLAGSQGGHIYAGEYIPGSDYAPFSSQLNFLGFPVPYWYYQSGNGLIKENLPTKSSIESEISRYISENLNENCNFESLIERGFEITAAEPAVKTSISDSEVSVDVTANVIVKKNEASAAKTSHSAEITSKLGTLYNSAKLIYDEERENAFLENYSIDTLYLYAPVTGVEISCAGKIWKTRDVVEELKSGLEANIGAIKLDGNYYSLAKNENKYFVVNIPTEQQVNFLYSRQWPTKVEVYGADNELMIAKPVGAEQGMGIMGFCYSPYHFVYDVKYPVMVQIFEGTEVFQFPLVVIIDKNMPRQAVLSEIPEEEEEVDICQFNTQDIYVNVYDINLNKVDANISYICFNQQCNLGATTDGVFSGKAPACVNGYLNVKSEGYGEKRQLFSSNSEGSADVIIDREYEVNVELEVGGRPFSGTAIVVFDGAKSVSTALPNNEKIKISEGLYNVTVYAYANSSLTIPASTKTQCSEVAKGGVLGLFGATEERCFDITIPETKLEAALIGGGKSEIYILPSDLEKGALKLKVDSLPTPNSIEELQSNYLVFDAMEVVLDI